MLRLFDTAVGSVVELSMRQEGKVSMYVCGPTVYGPAHLGHGRFVLVFDVLRRYLESQGIEVLHVSNITDVDDKILERASREGRTPGEVAAEFERLWWEDLDKMGVLRPHYTPHATEWISQMVELIAELVKTGYAYSIEDGVYLDVSKIPGYGLLARQDLAELRAGARIEQNDSKRSPMDFALWKKTGDGSWGWESPYGNGRPGWHTECVAMSLGILGDGFELHGGGLDLAFPHHENERAQAVALGRVFAGHWVHNGFVETGGEKMSKSLGNFETLAELFANSDPRAYRLLVLRSHYRSPMEVNPEIVADAERGLKRIDSFRRRFDRLNRSSKALAEVAGDEMELQRFRSIVDQDLDTPGGLAHAFGVMARANSFFDRGDLEVASSLAKSSDEMFSSLGLIGHELVEVIPPHVKELADRRSEARSARDFAVADSLRKEIEDLGYVVQDSGNGYQLHRA